MPLYEYRCDKCGTRIEKIQKFSDPPLKTYEACGGTLSRLLSAPAIQFKGTGWYVTDYARKASASNDEGSSTSSSTGTPAAKPAETSSPAPSKTTKPA